MTICLVDDNLTTGLIAETIRNGWIDDADSFELVSGLTAETVADRGACALLDGVEALRLADRFTVATDVGLVSWHSGAIALLTPTRPDEVDDVMVELNGVSPTAEAIARATIARFFGMTLRGFRRGDETGGVSVREHQDAILEIESGVLTDLVRAWFILSGLPVVTHAMVVPNDLIERAPDTVRTLVTGLGEAAQTGVKRRREIRRNMHSLYPVDRDQLVTFHNEQTISLSKTARKGWLDLVRRVGRAMSLPQPEAINFVTVEEPDEESEQG